MAISARLQRPRPETEPTADRHRRLERPRARRLSGAPAHYQLYGLGVRSRLALPCPRAQPGTAADVELTAGGLAQFTRARAEIVNARATENWFSCRQLADGATYLQWTGLFEFLISPDGRRILYHRQEQATFESLTVYLLGQVLSFSLLAFGVDSLHGTVVDVDGEAVAFLGDCGYGKSTLGAALLARGYPILTDDLVALEERDTGWMAHPGIPRLKLFPSVARRLLGREVAGTPMNRGTSKLVLPLTARQSTQRPLPLKAIYVLSKPRASGGPARARIRELSGPDAFLEIIRAAFNLLVLESGRFANQFLLARRLVAGVSVRRLTYPRKLSALPAVCDALLADVRR